VPDPDWMVLPFIVLAINCVTVVAASVELAPVAVMEVPVMPPATVKFPADVIWFDELKNWILPVAADCSNRLLVLVAEIWGVAPVKVKLPSLLKTNPFS